MEGMVFYKNLSFVPRYGFIKIFLREGKESMKGMFFIKICLSYIRDGREGMEGMSFIKIFHLLCKKDRFL
jgi:hypothetical protein